MNNGYDLSLGKADIVLWSCFLYDSQRRLVRPALRCLNAIRKGEKHGGPNAGKALRSVGGAEGTSEGASYRNMYR